MCIVSSGILLSACVFLGYNPEITRDHSGELWVFVYTRLNQVHKHACINRLESDCFINSKVRNWSRSNQFILRLSELNEVLIVRLSNQTFSLVIISTILMITNLTNLAVYVVTSISNYSSYNELPCV